MPPILSWDCDDAMRASPTGNNWRQRGRDSKSDCETANQSDKVAWEQQRHRCDGSCLPML